MLGRSPLDLAGFTPHRTIEDIDVRGDGRAVPGMVARFYRRPEGDRIASLGHYTYEGRDTLLAWGWVGDPHCAFHAVGRPGHGWDEPRPGCPRAELVLDGANRVVGVLLV
ncbi:hypothetical protein [Cryptosporangium japonicum]|uniref:GNAT family N-acetyltransferase n=1 Tax=Cryptosporangium japonicum TaxID=80872 RepID=A0ABP3EA38_9ACTN